MSISSVFLHKAAQVFGFPRIVKRAIFHPPRGMGAVSERMFVRHADVLRQDVDGSMLLTVRPYRGSGNHIFFLHGGAYAIEAFSPHRYIIKYFLKNGFSVTFFDYPLVPEHTAKHIHEAVFKAYKITTAAFADDTFFLFGDSAGGALSLSLLQRVLDDAYTCRPYKTAVISAPVDATGGHPDIAEYSKKERILPVDALISLADIYAGELPLSHPVISPTYGRLHGLGSLLLCYSYCEVFFPDNDTFFRKLEGAEGTYPKKYIGENLMHDWIVAPIPERRQTLGMICDFFAEDCVKEFDSV